ncbi:hypothetical protein EHS25_004470 [Saitozyma podzolica]|uniref:Uncharacterized protein n=1 Tax=Saitozyma podzolica TaxID=1890683 RepID=A0A427YUJ2_9TREE|nr:hypothetical protein EHS25_004470 [Saitozyma podzolica]
MAGSDVARENPHGITTVGVGTGSGTGAGANGRGQEQFASGPGSNPSSRRESDIGAGLGLPPIQSGNFARDYSMSEGIPKSAGYPGMMYGSVALPDGSLPSPTLGTSDGDLFVGPDEYAQALGIYEHILSALPHIRPSTVSTPEAASAQAYDTLLQLASDGTSLLSGSAPARRSSTIGTPGSGLVHMKMLRRQKREAERAQAKSGQPSGSGK